MHIHSVSIAAIALAISFTLAAPTPEGVGATELERRGATFEFGEHTGSWSKYPDGSGKYVKSTDDYHYTSREHCWTDVFHVSNGFVPLKWVKGDNSIDCATTQNCASGTVKGSQECTTWSLGKTADIVKAEASIADIIKVSSGIGVTITKGTVGCKTTSTTNTCTWNDKACHALWTSNVVMRHYNYVRRRCGSKGNDRTVWSYDVDIDDPQDDTRLGCAATCSMNDYPSPVPAAPQA